MHIGARGDTGEMRRTQAALRVDKTRPPDRRECAHERMSCGCGGIGDNVVNVCLLGFKGALTTEVILHPAMQSCSVKMLVPIA